MKKLFTLLSVTMLFVGLNAGALEKAETPDINAETAALASDFNAQSLKRKAIAGYEQTKKDIQQTWDEAKNKANALKEKAKAKYHEIKADWYENK